MSQPPIEAAGAVVWRNQGGAAQVLVIHRSRYDDWSLPKGKLDPGEHAATAAVREVHEETGVAVRLGPLLARHEYRLRRIPGATKQVTYWCARPLDGAGAEADVYEPNREVDDVRWVALDEVGAALTYARDAAVLERFAAVVRSKAHLGAPLVVLRHGAAKARRAWDGPELERPLADAGHAQAERLVPLLRAYAVSRVATSDAKRCIRTVQPYAAAAGVGVDPDARWSEEGADPADVRVAARELLEVEEPTVLCTHRPVLPWVLEGLGLPHRRLEPAAALIVHRREGGVVGTELLRP